MAQSFRSAIQYRVQQNPSLAGGLVRLAFHDAATTTMTSDGPFSLPLQQPQPRGPNGSIQFELERSENRGLAKPLKVVQQTLLVLYEQEYGSSSAEGMSLADAIALAGAAAIESIGGPCIPIRMGRKDATQPDPEFLTRKLRGSTARSLVEKTLPTAGLDSDGLRLYFGQLGLTEKEFVALSGSHGLGRHVSLLGMSKECLRNLTRTCLEDAPVLLPFVTDSVDRFDNSYFRFLLKWNDNDIQLGDVAFIPTDVDLVVDKGLRKWVVAFAEDQDYFFQVYTRAYQKLVDRMAVGIGERY
eukprot:scaffold9951_cov146-Cylindrotheca_fusiformis.AAC.10